MKKFVLFLMCFVLAFSLSAVFATEEGTTFDEPELNLEEDLGTNLDESLDDESLEIDNYEDFESVNQFGYTQAELEEFYVEQQRLFKNYYIDYSREDIGDKARVVRIDVEEDATVVDDKKGIYSYYYLDSSYNSVGINKYQALTIEFLEGDYKGEQAKLYHNLTMNSLGNVEVAPLSEGDIIYATGTIYEDELMAEIVSVDAYISRWGVIAVFTVVIVALIVVYAGKKGILSALFIALILDLIILVFVPFVIDGVNPCLMAVIIGAVLIVVNCVAKLGLKGISGFSMIVAFVLMLVSMLALFGVCYAARLHGVTLEISLIADNVLLQNIDFYHLFVSILVLIASVVLSDLVCDVFRTIRAESDSLTMNEKFKLCRDVLTSKLSNVSIIFVGLIIYKILLLSLYKYTFVEFINSEVLFSELVRLLVLLFAMTITVPVTVLLEDFFMKKSEEEKQ